MNVEIHESSSNNNFLLILILKISCFFVFIGRAWEHIRWDPPYREILWDQMLLEGIVKGLTGMTWATYASSDRVDNVIQNGILAIGCFYVLCAISSLIISKKNTVVYKICKVILIIGALGLVLLAFLHYLGRFLEVGQFFEYAAQFGSPIFLLLAISGALKNSFKLLLKGAIALTFICHGLYALGYYSTPGEWVDMIILSLNVSEQSAFSILYVAGILDIVFSVLLFIPGFTKPAAIYLVFWGVLTTISRIYANLYLDSILLILERYLHEVLYRLPHFLLPLLLIIGNNDKIILLQQIFSKKKRIEYESEVAYG
ncbi:MAG: hypothetical protein M3Q58_15205 [Bacteroidota bacterium]|nr:hypothetical protein [Bacteroidota bacterium]